MTMMRKVLALALYLLCGTCGADNPPPPGPVVRAQEEIIGNIFVNFAGCRLLPSGISEILSNMKVVAPIRCDEFKVIVIPRGYSIVLYAEGEMELRSLHIYVEPGARLALVAGSTITLGRFEEDMYVPVLDSEGEVYFFANSRDPLSEIGEVIVPQGPQTLIKSEGLNAVIYSEDEIEYTPTAIIVGATTNDTAGGIHNELTDGSVGKEGTRHEDLQTGQDHTVDVTTDDDIEKEKEEAMSEPLSNNVHTVESARDTDDDIEKEKEEAMSEPLSNNVHTIESAQPTMDDDEMAAKEHAGISDADTHKLKVGEILRDGSLTLTSKDGGFKLWAGKKGSLLFQQYLKQKNAKGDAEDSKQIMVTTIIPVSKARLKGVLERRAIVEGEGAGEGSDDVGKTKRARAWTPWGIRHNRQIEKARKHMGEVDLTLNNKGCVRVSVDGCCVLSRSGPYSMEWVNKFLTFGRRRSSEYELHVVTNGMEVQLGERRIWGVRAPIGDTVTSGEQSTFSMTKAELLD